MTVWIVSVVVSVGLALLVGWVIPAWAITGLLPVLKGADRLVTNYRGRRIPTGLGLVWLVWAAGVGAMTTLVSLVMRYGLQYSAASSWPSWLTSSSFSDVAKGLPVLLVVGAVAFGLVDDVFGAGDAKGFRGHLGALTRGRLTTGGLKLLGIGALAVAAASTAASFSSQTWSETAMPRTIAAFFCAILVIALSANFVNLTDLRPGRALKAYSLLALLGVVFTTVGVWHIHLTRLALASRSAEVSGASALLWIAGLVLCLLVFAFGPVVATWRYDLGERAMLGDAGANAMGALAGYLLVWRSPLWLIALLAVILLGLNLASERVSFTRVIERVGFLRWFDGLGRLPAEPESVPGHDGGDGVRAGGSAADGDDARRDGRISKR
jgi:hypothetical protein